MQNLAYRVTIQRKSSEKSVFLSLGPSKKELNIAKLIFHWKQKFTGSPQSGKVVFR